MKKNKVLILFIIACMLFSFSCADANEKNDTSSETEEQDDKSSDLWQISDVFSEPCPDDKYYVFMEELDAIRKDPDLTDLEKYEKIANVIKDKCVYVKHYEKGTDTVHELYLTSEYYMEAFFRTTRPFSNYAERDTAFEFFADSIIMLTRTEIKTDSVRYEISGYFWKLDYSIDRSSYGFDGVGSLKYQDAMDIINYGNRLFKKPLIKDNIPEYQQVFQIIEYKLSSECSFSLYKKNFSTGHGAKYYLFRDESKVLALEYMGRTGVYCIDCSQISKSDLFFLYYDDPNAERLFPLKNEE